MNVLLIDDLFIEICGYIDNVKELLKLELLSKYHCKIIRNVKWIHFELYIRSDEMLDAMLENHKFGNLFLPTDANDENVSKLINCHTLDLSYTKVTDKSVSKLINCHTLNLAGTKVTDESVSKLINCHKLYYCGQCAKSISDKCIEKMRKRGCKISTDAR